MNTEPRCKRLIAQLILSLILLLMLACLESPPAIPCDEKVKNPGEYEALLRENPVILQLNDELTLRKVGISDCFMDNRLDINFTYVLPLKYSAYGITYIDLLGIGYAKDKTITVSGIPKPPEAFDKSAIINYFKQRVKQLESDPRVQEVIEKSQSDSQWEEVLFTNQPEIVRGHNRIQYNFSSGLVRGYLLSNEIDWQALPEIRHAHQVIEQNLLVGDLASCKIGKSDMHNYTQAQFHDSPEGPWYLTVALLCDDGWKDAYVQINKDMSFEQLKIKQSYNNK